jgi:uncharacterized membrane protein
MASTTERWTDVQIEIWISRLLRFGVLLSSAIVLGGGIAYLIRYGTQAPHYRTFHDEPAPLHSLRGILGQAVRLHPRAIIQLGLLVLIATPIARVVFAVVAFALEKDWLYVGVTLIVLGVLGYSLFAGR